MKYNFNEIFCSIQGEGQRFGSVNIFIRFAGCNLKCSFCDTKHDMINYSYSLQELYNHIKQYKYKNIIFTGGEPFVQLDQEVIDFFKEKKYYIAVETNGEIENKIKGIDWLTVSPKTSDFKIKSGEELKVLFPTKFYLKDLLNLTNFNHYLLQPMAIEFNDYFTKRNTKRTIQKVMEEQGWKLSIQSHKILEIQ